MIPYQFEITTGATAVLVAVIVAVYLLVLKRNGWIGKASTEQNLPQELTLEKPEAKIHESVASSNENKVAPSKESNKEPSSTVVNTQPSTETREIKPEPVKEESNDSKKPNNKKAKNSKKDRPEGCNNFFGYLGTLPKGTAVPDECYCCTDLINCYKNN